MTSLLRTLALAVVAAGALAFVTTPEAKGQRLIYQSFYPGAYYAGPYYSGPYYAGTAVTYRRPILGPRTTFYAPAYGVAPVYSAPTVVGYGGTTTYYVPTTTYYGGTVVAPTVTNYPGTTVYYGGTVAPLPVPAVSYRLPTVVYPPAVFP